MTTNDILQQGELAKYQMAITRQDFNMSTGNFKVDLYGGMDGWHKTIEKSDMLESTGGFIFSFDTSEVLGNITAVTTWYYDDSDVQGSVRAETDNQTICAVVVMPTNCVIIPPAGNHDVTFTRLETSDIAEKYERLVDIYDRPILTVDGEYIYVLRNE